MARKPAAYVRKSKKLEESAAAQLAVLKELAQRDGVNGELEVYEDIGRSGRYGQRGPDTAWGRLLADVEAGRVSTIYVRVLDRAGRSLEEWLAFLRLCRENEVRIVDQTGERSAPEGYDLTVIEMLMAEREGKKAQDRSRLALATQQKRGDVIGHPPYGYQVGWQDGRRAFVPNPAEPVAAALAAVRKTGGNVARAARLLNEGGTPTRGGKSWDPRTLRRVIEREAPNLLAPRTGATRQRVRPSVVSPLSRLVRCHCGQILTPVQARGWAYCSVGHKQGAAAHGPYVVRLSVIEKALREELSKLRVKVFSVEKALTENLAIRTALVAKRERLGWAVTDGLLPREQARNQAAAIDAELEELTDDEVWTGITESTRVDWSWEPIKLGDVLRKLFREVRLGVGTTSKTTPGKRAGSTTLEVVEVVWRVPEWRRA